MDLVARYLDHVRFEKRLAERTLTLYALDLDKLKDYAAHANVALEAVQSTHIRRWVSQMHSGGRSGRGIALILSGWRGFYGWLGREGLITSNPVQDVRAPKAPKPLPKALSVDDAVQLADYHAAPDASDPWLECRDAAMVELLYGCGLRVGELVGLDVQAGAQAKGWIDLDGGEAYVLGKGSKRRSVPVGGKALEAMRAWCAVRDQGLTAATHDQTAMFIGRHGTRLTAQAVWQRVRLRSLKAGLSTPVHPHMLRHSFASHVLQSSQDLRGVQELLGHTNITTTQVYTRLDFQHLAQAYDSAHPRARKK
jgi:integrase/recombinase XerC